ncbi:GNAT family N-acetyltransferase [Flavobacterium sp. I3-2]|uniref:GNAT family N-acetyltransferase n=1 Tax=Flavobacterium sp. I3-2 TaxID=2748319 RepID=UPI001C4A36AB|nr:GNAT family protein [Flavobacterium sp. I3-2]
MKVKLASVSDLKSILNVIELAKQIMLANGNTTQWINGYPSEEIILKDMEQNYGFVIVNNGEIEGYFCFLKGNNPEPTYQLIKDGNWLNNEAYGVIHRLASSGRIKGIADACFDFCFSEINNIKVDTHENNIPMQNYFKKIGFTYCGIIYVNDGSPRRAFQKSI